MLPRCPKMPPRCLPDATQMPPDASSNLSKTSSSKHRLAALWKRSTSIHPILNASGGDRHPDAGTTTQTMPSSERAALMHTMLHASLAIGQAFIIGIDASRGLPDVSIRFQMLPDVPGCTQNDSQMLPDAPQDASQMPPDASPRCLPDASQMLPGATQMRSGEAPSSRTYNIFLQISPLCRFNSSHSGSS